jgi:hypothetical protein
VFCRPQSTSSIIALSTLDYVSNTFFNPRLWVSALAVAIIQDIIDTPMPLLLYLSLSLVLYSRIMLLCVIAF